MTKVLEADCSAGDSYVSKTFGAVSAPWYVQLGIAIPSATFTALAAANYTAYLLGLGSSVDDGLFVTAYHTDGTPDTFAGGDKNYWTFGTPADPVAGLTPDTFHEVKVSYVGGTITWNIDGGDVFSYAFSVTLDQIQVGGEFSNGIPGEIYYISDVRVGTAPGGHDVFADDFSSGDLSAWTQVFGDCNVVDDPFPSVVAFHIATPEI